NLFSCLYKKGIPVVTVNGRISDSSFRGYSRIKFLLKPILNRVSVFCVQTTADAQRLKSLGVAEDKIRVTGNVKFDIRPYSGVDSSSVRKRLGITVGYKLLVAGSTHQGEEEIILAVYKQLLKVHPDLRLLLAPRHPERAQEVGRLVLSCGFEPVFISKLSQLPNTYRLPPVFILDTIGQLMDYYAAADIVFVGGSLIEKGGHNILEPASLNKPILFGPHMFNFREITELFLENKSAVMVRNGQELSGQLEVLLVDPFKREDLGSRSSRLLRQNQGATKRNLEFIKSALTINQDIKGKKG
ncbi:MAG: 3-deoxy-D-manno-octulosonic acid transferase, partial [Candidatus Omnitrophica bacterium]|nr:3-deoxy-D-manno-octulosonic acid transferase [Candidatus Omnitrophota bacterium]